MTKRIILFFTLFVITFLFPWWVGVPLMVLYMFRYTAYEVIVLATLFDAQFSVAYGLMPFFYTIGFGIFFVVLEVLKPFLTFYRESS